MPEPGRRRSRGRIDLSALRGRGVLAIAVVAVVWVWAAVLFVLLSD